MSELSPGASTLHSRELLSFIRLLRLRHLLFAWFISDSGSSRKLCGVGGLNEDELEDEIVAPVERVWTRFGVLWLLRLMMVVVHPGDLQLPLALPAAHAARRGHRLITGWADAGLQAFALLGAVRPGGRRFGSSGAAAALRLS